MAMFKYMAVRLTTMALSSLMPFPKHMAAETSSKLQICRMIRMYCATVSETKRYTYGKMATGNDASARQVKSWVSFPTLR